jgi:hypothetical protein
MTAAALPCRSRSLVGDPKTDRAGPEGPAPSPITGRSAAAAIASGRLPGLPLGSEVKVTNLENGRSVVVAINDRGPYIGGRVIDLSKAAARRLGIVEEGLAKARIEATPQQLALAER